MDVLLTEMKDEYRVLSLPQRLGEIARRETRTPEDQKRINDYTRELDNNEAELLNVRNGLAPTLKPLSNTREKRTMETYLKKNMYLNNTDYTLVPYSQLVEPPRIKRMETFIDTLYN